MEVISALRKPIFLMIYCVLHFRSEIFDDLDDSYWFFERLRSAVINEHAPVKCKTITHSQVPYMNGELRRNVNYKNTHVC